MKINKIKSRFRMKNKGLHIILRVDSNKFEPNIDE